MRTAGIFALGALMLFAFALPACSSTPDRSSGAPGGSSGSGATITVEVSSFAGATTVSIAAGQSVTFDNSAGGIHQLVTGTHGTLIAASGAPSELTAVEGLALSPGDEKTVTFSTAGTYQVTCLIHPSMATTIIVT